MDEEPSETEYELPRIKDDSKIVYIACHLMIYAFKITGILGVVYASIILENPFALLALIFFIGRYDHDYNK